MDSTSRAALRRLITEQKVLSLAVLVDRRPVLGLLAYALQSDFSAVLIHASSLARHTQGLRPGAPFSFLIHDSVIDPLQVVRASFEGAVAIIERGSPDFERGRDLFLRRFPESGVLFTLADFRMCSLPLQRGRFVQGLARAVDVSADDLKA